MNGDASRKSLAGEMLDQSSKRSAQGDDCCDVIGRKIGSRCGRTRSFPADLKHADDFFAVQDRGTDNFLNRFGTESFGFNPFEHARVACFVKTVVNFRAIFPSGARRQGRRAGERYEPNIFESLRNEKVQMPPFLRNCKNGDLFRADAQRFCDTLRDGG